MAAINQRIPNFLGGVSQQPDFIKFPGQLRSCDNAVPDVTFGLMKRPPAEYVNKLTNTTSTGQWFEIINKVGNELAEEKYIGQITPANYASNPIRIWRLDTGDEMTVQEHGTAYDYLQNATGKLGVHTIQDYTYITNPQKVVTANTATTDRYNSGKAYAFVKIDTLAYNTEYVIHLGAAGATMPAADPKLMATGITTYRNSGYELNEDGTNSNRNVAGKSSWKHPNTGSGLSGQKDYDGGSTANAKGIRATVVVNGQPMFQDQEKEYQDNDTTDEAKFLGYVQNYDIRYTATATLKDGGIDVGPVGTVIANAVGIPDDSGTAVGYDIEITGTKAYDTYRYKSGTAKYITPKNADRGTLSMANVLNGLKADLDTQYNPGGANNYTFTVVGGGILIKKVAAGAMNVQVLGGMANEALSVFQDSAQDVSKLPPECAHDYLVEVANTEESDSDNYWLKFKADDGVKGSGVWEETVAPHISKGLNVSTLPCALVANRVSGSILDWKFAQLDGTSLSGGHVLQKWSDREVGDTTTNSDPSFVGEKIQQTFFYRNRLGFIANEQVVLSQPGDYHNFYAVSVLTSSDDNPIDISVSDIRPAYITHVLPTQKGVMLFSENGQFMLFSDADSFSSKTARLKKLASYECSPLVKPLDLGTTYMFVNHAGTYSRAFEMAIVDESIPPKIIDQTRVVPELMPKSINLSSVSADLGLVSYGINNSTYNSSTFSSSTIYTYKYFDTGDQREQSAWYTWTLPGVLRHCLYNGGNFYTVTQQTNNEFILNRYEYLSSRRTVDATVGARSMDKRAYTIGDPAIYEDGEGNIGRQINRTVEAALDNLVVYKKGATSGVDPQNTSLGVTVAYSGGNTVITVPYTVDAALDPRIVVISNEGYPSNQPSNEAGVVKAPDSVSGTTMTFNNIDMTNWHMAIGYTYVTWIELPQYYFAYDQGKYDIDGDLRMGGYNFELGLSGPMKFIVKDVIGNSDLYTQEESGMLTDWNNFQEIPSLLNRSIRVPIYRKNHKFRFYINIDQPFSATIVSASWDGRYNTRRHVRK